MNEAARAAVRPSHASLKDELQRNIDQEVERLLTGALPASNRRSPLSLGYAKPALASPTSPLAPQHASSLGVGWGGAASRRGGVRAPSLGSPLQRPRPRAFSPTVTDGSDDGAPRVRALPRQGVRASRPAEREGAVALFAPSLIPQSTHLVASGSPVELRIAAGDGVELEWDEGGAGVRATLFPTHDGSGRQQVALLERWLQGMGERLAEAERVAHAAAELGRPELPALPTDLSLLSGQLPSLASLRAAADAADAAAAASDGATDVAVSVGAVEMAESAAAALEAAESARVDASLAVFSAALHELARQVAVQSSERARLLMAVWLACAQLQQRQAALHATTRRRLGDALRRMRDERGALLDELRGLQEEGRARRPHNGYVTGGSRSGRVTGGASGGYGAEGARARRTLERDADEGEASAAVAELATQAAKAAHAHAATAALRHSHHLLNGGADALLVGAQWEERTRASAALLGARADADADGEPEEAAAAAWPLGRQPASVALNLALAAVRGQPQRSMGCQTDAAEAPTLAQPTPRDDGEAAAVASPRPPGAKAAGAAAGAPSARAPTAAEPLVALAASGAKQAACQTDERDTGYNMATQTDADKHVLRLRAKDATQRLQKLFGTATAVVTVKETFVAAADGGLAAAVVRPHDGEDDVGDDLDDEQPSTGLVLLPGLPPLAPARAGGDGRAAEPRLPAWIPKPFVKYLCVLGDGLANVLSFPSALRRRELRQEMSQVYAFILTLAIDEAGDAPSAAGSSVQVAMNAGRSASYVAGNGAYRRTGTEATGIPVLTRVGRAVERICARGLPKLLWHYCLTLDSKPARAARSLIALLSSSYALGHTASADLRIGVFARLCGLLGSAQAGGGSDESPSLAVVCMALAVVLPPRALVRRPADSDARVRPAAYLPVDQVSAERLRAIEAGAGLGTDGRDEARRERSAIEAIALLGLSEAHSALLIASVNDAAESIRTLDGMAASEAQPRRIALETFLALCARTRWEALGARTHELRELFRGTANLTLGLLIRYEQFGELIRSLNATFAQDAVAEMYADALQQTRLLAQLEFADDDPHVRHADMPPAGGDDGELPASGTVSERGWLAMAHAHALVPPRERRRSMLLNPRASFTAAGTGVEQPAASTLGASAIME